MDEQASQSKSKTTWKQLATINQKIQKMLATLQAPIQNLHKTVEKKKKN